MSWIKKAIIGVTAIILLPSSAPALCFYNGQLNAKTTLSQEFSDSTWVVRAKVVAADSHWSDEDDSWTIYHLVILTTFKGNPQSRIEMFTYRDSGGFFLDKGMNANLGGEYLLFLDPISRREKVPTAALKATEVNYSCGQSKEWNTVSSVDQKRLTTFSQRK